MPKKVKLPGTDEPYMKITVMKTSIYSIPSWQCPPAHPLSPPLPKKPNYLDMATDS